MIKTRLCLAALLVAVASAYARTWTNADGKTLEADIVRVNGDRVYLRLVRNKQVHSVKIATLSEADQAYIKDYEQQQIEGKKMAERAKRTAKWIDDPDDAVEESKALNLPIFVLFTAPEWCGYCIKLNDQILGTPEFRHFANINLVLLEVDCSAPRSDAPWRKKNPEFAEKCPPVRGFPTAFLIGVDGEVLGQFGYSDDSPAKYAESIKAKIK